MRKNGSLRRYAQVVGVGLVLLSISGVLLDLPGFSLVVDSFHLLMGFALVYAGLSRCPVRHCCAIVAGSGLLFLVIGMIDSAVALLVFDLDSVSLYERSEEALFWVVIGLLSLLGTALVGEDAPTSSPN